MIEFCSHQAGRQAGVVPHKRSTVFTRGKETAQEYVCSSIQASQMICVVRFRTWQEEV